MFTIAREEIANSAAGRHRHEAATAATTPLAPPLVGRS
jgi:hypothetical protein